MVQQWKNAYGLYALNAFKTSDEIGFYIMKPLTIIMIITTMKNLPPRQEEEYIQQQPRDPKT